MELLERTIFKKKNKEIASLYKTLDCVSQKSHYNYEENRKLRTENINIKSENEELSDLVNALSDRVHKLVGRCGGYAKSNNILRKKVLEKDKEIENITNKLTETKRLLDESMTDKFIRRKIKAANTVPKQTMKVNKSSYLEGKIISKIKE